jgi:hypothetical protein
VDGHNMAYSPVQPIQQWKSGSRSYTKRTGLFNHMVLVKDTFYLIFHFTVSVHCLDGLLTQNAQHISISGQEANPSFPEFDSDPEPNPSPYSKLKSLWRSASFNKTPIQCFGLVLIVHVDIVHRYYIYMIYVFPSESW